MKNLNVFKYFFKNNFLLIEKDHSNHRWTPRSQANFPRLSWQGGDATREAFVRDFHVLAAVDEQCAATRNGGGDDDAKSVTTTTAVAKLLLVLCNKFRRRRDARLKEMPKTVSHCSAGWGKIV